MADKQLLHLVLGGDVKDPQSVEFTDVSKIEVVGIFPNYAEARKAWRAKAASTVDDAHRRYFVVHLHRLLDPSTDTTKAADATR